MMRIQLDLIASIYSHDDIVCRAVKHCLLMAAEDHFFHFDPDDFHGVAVDLLNAIAIAKARCATIYPPLQARSTNNWMVVMPDGDCGTFHSAEEAAYEAGRAHAQSVIMAQGEVTPAMHAAFIEGQRAAKAARTDLVEDAPEPHVSNIIRFTPPSDPHGKQT